MSLCKATVLLPYLGGLDRDISEMTFWADIMDGDEEDGLTQWLAALGDFYTAGALPLQSFLAPWIDDDNAVVRFAFIEATTGLQQGPTIQQPFPLTVPAAEQGLPAEVALCISWAADLGGGSIRRRRGRTYIGPLNVDALAEDATNYARPSSGVLTSLATAGGEYLADSVADDAWLAVIYSRADQEMKLINRGWVDNEFDTQRRRGADSTTRSTFSA